MAKFDPDKRVYYVDDGQGGYDEVPETAYGVGTAESLMINAGKTFTDIGRGVRDLFGSDTAVADQAEADQLMAPLQEQNPISSIVGQALPYLATASLGGATILGQSALAAGTGALRQTGDLTDRLKTGAVEGAFGAAGAGLTSMAGRVMNSARGVYQNKLAGELIRQGGKVTPGQGMGGQVSGLDTVMDSLGAFGDIKAANQSVLQGQVSRSLGQQAVDLSETGLGDAADAIGARMDMALDGLNIQVPDGIIERVNTVVGENKFLQMPASLQNMDGKTYQQVRRQLTDIARTEAKTATPTPGKMEYVSDTISALDDEFAAVAGPQKKAVLRTAREQWRNLIAVERGQALTPDGEVNARTLRTNLNRMYGPAARRGKDDRLLKETQEMIQGARTQSSKALAPQVGNSGTATRLGLGLGLPALAGLGTYGAGGDQDQAVLTALSAYALSKGYGKAGNLLAGAPEMLAPGLGRALGQGAAQ